MDVATLDSGILHLEMHAAFVMSEIADQPVPSTPAVTRAQVPNATKLQPPIA